MRTSDHQERWLLRLVKRVFAQEILSGAGRFAPGPETGQGLVLVLKVEITSRRRRTLSPQRSGSGRGNLTSPPWSRSDVHLAAMTLRPELSIWLRSVKIQQELDHALCNQILLGSFSATRSHRR